MQKSHVQLTDLDRHALYSLLNRGTSLARTFKRARALLALDARKTYQATVKLAGLSHIVSLFYLCILFLVRPTVQTI